MKLWITVLSMRKMSKECQPRRRNHYSKRMKMKIKQQINLTGRQKRPLNLEMRPFSGFYSALLRSQPTSLANGCSEDKLEAPQTFNQEEFGAVP